MDPMTYKEIKKRLVQCEYTLNCLKDGSYKNLEPAEIQAKTEKLTTLKENLLKKLDVLKEETTFIKTKGGETQVVDLDNKSSLELKKDPQITSITTVRGKQIKEGEFDNKAMSAIAIETGKAVAKSLKEVGDEVARMKAKRIETNSFDIHVTYKGEGRDDEFSFYIDPEDDTLHLVDFSFDQKLVDIGEKPSGEPLVNVDLLTNELVKHFSKDIVNEGYYDNYEPKHFDICPGATALRDRLVAGEFGKQEPVVVGKWTELHDDLFRLEKRVIEKNYAQDAHARTANDLRDEIIHLSRDLNIPAAEIGYLKGHVNKIIDIGMKSGGIREVVDDKDTEALKQLSKDLKGSSQAHLDQKKKLDKLINTEGEGDDHHYIKVPRREFKKAMSILDGATDGNFVKMDFVDNDGAGNVIIYFDFSSGYIASGQADAFMYDAVMDLQTQDVNVSDHSAELDENKKEDEKANQELFAKLARKALADEVDENVTQKHIDDIEASGNIDIAYKKAMELLKSMIAKNEAVDHNDPVLMRARVAKMRANDMKKLDALKKSDKRNAPVRAIIAKLKAKRAEVEREMENDPGIEPEGGPVADKYGDQLNKIDNAIEKAASKLVKEGDDDYKYDGEHQGSNYKWPMSDYMKRRKEADDYYEDPDYYKEDVDVGHQDDEPSMLKNTAYESATYAAKLYKKLAKYDQHDGEVDFPNWWQSKLILAKDYLSKAFHYLDSEEKQPMLDKLALEEGVNEATDLYDRNGIQITRFSGGERGLMVQINYGGKYIHVPADEFATLARAMQSVIGDIRDMTLQMPRKNYPKNEALDSDLPKGKHSIAKLQKVHGMIVDKMKELAKLYKEEGPDHEYNGHPVIDHLKSLTSKKKKVEAALDKAVSNKGKGQELDPNINEVTEDQVQDAIGELRDLIDQIEAKGDEAREIIRDVFPNELSRLDAYGAFNNMYSANRYDVTLGGFVDRLEEEGFEIEDGEVFTNEGDYKSDAQRKAIYAAKAEKEKKNEAAPGFKHDCASKVVHKEHGAGTCIPEKHTLVKEGSKYVVTHYDVLFESGKTVTDIPVSELEIKTQTEHWHKGYKKKKK